jgi:hypothetical protein
MTWQLVAMQTSLPVGYLAWKDQEQEVRFHRREQQPQKLGFNESN